MAHGAYRRKAQRQRLALGFAMICALLLSDRERQAVTIDRNPTLPKWASAFFFQFLLILLDDFQIGTPVWEVFVPLPGGEKTIVKQPSVWFLVPVYMLPGEIPWSKLWRFCVFWEEKSLERKVVFSVTLPSYIRIWCIFWLLEEELNNLCFD